MRLACVLLLATCVLGCGGGPSSEVSGTVLVDGEPLSQGEIIFEAADKSLAPVSATVKDGKYSTKAIPGAKKVLLKASRPSAAQDKVMGTAPQESLLGPEYNERTTLTADLKAGKNENVNFTVKALPKKRR